jgi:bacterioferritin-associated ferredoxin
MAGCRLEHRASVGGWVPVRDRNLATTVPGIFAAGDGAGVAGAFVAAAEGSLAGLAASAHLGAIDARTFEAARVPFDRELIRLAPIRAALDRICALRPGLADLTKDGTIVCRCEEVPWSEVKAAVQAGCTTYRSLKVATRVGMGACQGCFCWPSIARLVASESGSPVEEVGPMSARPPVRPVTLGELAESTSEVA